MPCPKQTASFAWLRTGCLDRSCSQADDSNSIQTIITRWAWIAAESTNVGSGQRPKRPTRTATGTKGSVIASHRRARSSCCERQSVNSEPRSSASPSGRNTANGRATRSSSTTWGRSRITCIRTPSRRSSSDRKASPSRTTSRHNTTRPATTFRTRSWVSNRGQQKSRLSSAWPTGIPATMASSISQKPIASSQAPAG